MWSRQHVPDSRRHANQRSGGFGPPQPCSARITRIDPVLNCLHQSIRRTGRDYSPARLRPASAGDDFASHSSCRRTDVAAAVRAMRVYPFPITALLPAVSISGPKKSMVHRRGACTAVSRACSCVWLFHSGFASAPCPCLEHRQVARASTFRPLAGLH